MRPISAFSLKFLVSGSLLLLYTCAWGQESNSYDIRWVSQYPTAKAENVSGRKEKNSRRNNNWFTNLIFGKKPDNLVKPMSVVAISRDTFWVADQGNSSMLQVFQGEGEIIQFENMPVENIPSMVGSCFLPDHQILFTDSRLNKVFWFSPDNGELQILNDSLKLDQPTGIAYSIVNHQIWVVETSAHRIAILNDQGEFIRYIGGRGNAPGKFNFPTYIWIDAFGLAYVVDAMNFRVQIFDKEGEFISAFGEIGDASGYFSRPKGIACDSFGHIYVSDALFHVIQVFDKTGRLLHTFGSQGQGKEQFWMPTGIYIDQENYIYIADSYNSRVQVFQLTIGD